MGTQNTIAHSLIVNPCATKAGMKIKEHSKSLNPLIRAKRGKTAFLI